MNRCLWEILRGGGDLRARRLDHLAVPAPGGLAVRSRGHSGSAAWISVEDNQALWALCRDDLSGIDAKSLSSCSGPIGLATCRSNPASEARRTSSEAM